MLLNVCVQGPTAVRNSKWHLERATVDRELIAKGTGTESSAWGLQVIDEAILVQDKVFVGLFTREVTDGLDGTGNLLHYAFYYKLFSGRQAYAMAILNGEAGRAGYLDLKRTNPAPFAQGPSEQEFRRLVGVWRVGTVMDNRAVAGEDPYITVNVCIEWWTSWKPFVDASGGPPPPDRPDVNWLQKEYGFQIGAVGRGTQVPRSRPCDRPGQTTGTVQPSKSQAAFDQAVTVINIANEVLQRRASSRSRRRMRRCRHGWISHRRGLRRHRTLHSFTARSTTSGPTGGNCWANWTPSFPMQSQPPTT